MILQLKILQFCNFAILQFYDFTILQCLQCRNFTILMMISKGGGCQCGRREEDFMILKFANVRIYHLTIYHYIEILQFPLHCNVTITQF